MKRTTKSASKKNSKATKQTTKTKVMPIKKEYSGAPIPSTKVYRRKMEGFSAKQGNSCLAESWLMVNEKSGTYTFANTYNNRLPASYSADHYSYQLSEKAEKKLAKKIEVDGYEEVDATDWPSFTESAGRRAVRAKVTVK